MITSEERITKPRLLAATRPAGTRRVDSAAEQARRERGERPRRSSAGRPPTRRPTSCSGSSAASARPTSTSTDEIDAGLLRDLSAPELSAAISEIDAADSILVVGVDPLHAMPILDLRLRKAIRQSGARVCVASERPTALDGGAEETARYAPGEAAAFLTALARHAISPDLRHRTPGGEPRTWRELCTPMRSAWRRSCGPGKTVIVWGERLARGRGGIAALAALREAARALNSDADGAGLIGVPDGGERPRRARGRLPGRAPAPASRPPTRAATSSRSSRACSTASSTASSSATPTRCATSPTAPAGPRRCAARAPSSRSRLRGCVDQGRRRDHPGRGATPRRRARSPTPTAACSGCAPRSRAPTRCARSGRCSPRSPPRSATRPRSARPPTRSRRSPPRSPSTPAITADEIGGRGVRWQEREAAAAFPRDGALPHLEKAAEPGAHGAGRTTGLRLGHLPRSVGRRGHRAQPGVAIPRAVAAGRDRARRRRASWARRRRRGRCALQRHVASRRGSRCATGSAPAPRS